MTCRQKFNNYCLGSSRAHAHKFMKAAPPTFIMWCILHMGRDTTPLSSPDHEKGITIFNSLMWPIIIDFHLIAQIRLLKLSMQLLILNYGWVSSCSQASPGEAGGPAHLCHLPWCLQRPKDAELLPRLLQGLPPATGGHRQRGTTLPTLPYLPSIHPPPPSY